MNQIENLWGLVKQVVRKRLPRGRTELVAVIIYAWINVIKLETIHKLVDGMPNRMQAAIASKGFAIKY